MQNDALSILVRRQGGHITRAQLLAAGFTRRGIQNLIARGHLIRVYLGVYAVGHVPTAPTARAHAALLAVGERSALAGWSAASLYGVTDIWREPFIVITPTRADPSGVTVLHSTRLTRRDVTVVNGLRVVSPALTILQIAPDLSHRRLIRAIDTLRIERRLTHDQLRGAAQRFRSRSLDAVLGALQPEPTRSIWEQEWPAFAADQGLPPYAMNVVVGTTRVDVLFRGRLIVMLDGWEVHGSRHAFEQDREESARLMAATGLPVIRVTYRQFHDAPDIQAARIKAILARRAA